MASQWIFNSSWVDGSPITDGPVKSLPYLVAVFMALILFYSTHGSRPSAPLINPKKRFELTNTRSKTDFALGAREILRNWFSTNPDKPVCLITDTGNMTVLPPHMTDEIKNDDRLSFLKWAFIAFHGHVSSFEGFREASRDTEILQAVILKDLTKSLNKITEPLAEEASLVIPELFGNSPEWHTIPLRETILRLISRISSRVFLGEELCRNEDWLRITREYTVNGVVAAEQLRLWPAPTRRIVHWFLPSCRLLRAQTSEARRIIGPVLEQRRAQKLAMQAEGKDPVQFNDAIEWFERTSKGNWYDPALMQLLMSFVAIHTTTDLTCQTVADLAQHPEMIEPLRNEIITVFREGGWKKTSLYNMKLLDSVIKETQRMKPITIASLRRVALEDIKLSDGTFIPKNGMLSVSAHSMWDPQIHNNPEEWDGYRFYRMREMPGYENKAQLVSTSPDHLSFGHGQHACPGRFFAANEVKITLIHLLLKYDWRLPEGAVPKTRAFGLSLFADPTLKMEVRRREAEIEI